MIEPWKRREVIGDATLYLGDCREVLPTLAGKVDAVVTDPPYGEVTHKGARGRGSTTGGKHILVDFDALDGAEFCRMARAFTEYAKRWVVMSADWRHCVDAERAGLPVIRVGVWTKNDPAPQFSGDRPATGWEAVLILHRPGVKRWNGGGKPAVWRTGIVKNNGFHPSEKPLELISSWTELFSDFGETVLDPYMGGGTTGVACARAGRKFIGIELDPKHFTTACRRIDEAQRQGRLFDERPPKPEQLTLVA